MQHLNDIDYEILAYVRKNEPVTTEQIKAKFRKISAIEQRLSVLSKNKISDFGNPISNSSLIIEDTNIVGEGTHRRMEHLGTYRISDEGKTLLENYIIVKRKEFHNQIMSFAALVLGVITAVASIIAAIKQ